MLGLGLGIGSRNADTAASWATTPAPSGFRWEYVMSNSQQVTSNGAPVVALTEI